MVSTVPRFTLALGAALAVTFLVALIMQGLISSGGSVIEDKGFGKLVEFVHVQEDDDLQTKSRQVKKPPAPPEEPPKPEMAKPDLDMTANKVDMGSVDMSAGLSVDTGLAGARGDGEYLPIVRIAPQYPRRAAQKGIEGYVDLEFTVSKLGSTKDVVVINAQPANIFNRAAIASVLKYKYKPKVEDGKPIDVPGVQIRVTFEMAAK